MDKILQNALFKGEEMIKLALLKDARFFQVRESDVATMSDIHYSD